MIKFHCSKCNKKIAVPDESVGKRCQCPKCKTISVVPEASSLTEIPVTDNLIHFKCSQCKQELEAPEVMRGKTILCHHCQANTVVSEHESESSVNDEPMPFKLKEQTKDCPYCGEEILEKAIKCKHCREFLESNIVNSYQPSFNSTPIQNAPNSPEDFNWKPILYLVLIVGGIISVLSLSGSTIKELFQDKKSVESNVVAQAEPDKELIKFRGKLLTPEEYAQEKLRFPAKEIREKMEERIHRIGDLFRISVTITRGDNLEYPYDIDISAYTDYDITLDKRPIYIFHVNDELELSNQWTSNGYSRTSVAEKLITELQSVLSSLKY